MEAASVPAGRVKPVRHPRLLAFGRGLLNQSLNLYAALALIYLLLPIAIIILFSFNDTHSRFNFTWQGFTLRNWQDPFGVPGIGDAMLNSVKIAVLATIFATILGTMMALALVRYRVPRSRSHEPVHLHPARPLPRSCSAPRCCRCSCRSVMRRASPRS